MSRTWDVFEMVEQEDGRICEVHPFYWDTAAIAVAVSGGG